MNSFINGLQIKPKAEGIVSCFNYPLTAMLSARSVSCRKGSVNFFLAPNISKAVEHIRNRY